MRAVHELRLENFRSYPSLTAQFHAGPIWFAGQNGAGKTNILEAFSLLGPGRGLRRAKLSDCAYRLASQETGSPWIVAGQLRVVDDVYELGGRLVDGTRRETRLDGQAAGATRLAELLPMVWLTPQHDRLFVEGASDRRRFFDRLVLTDHPSHGKAVQTYEAAMRNRTKLLVDGVGDDTWLGSLERNMADAATMIAKSRIETMQTLQADIDGRPDGPFPKVKMRLEGFVENLINDNTSEGAQGQYANHLRAMRHRDGAAGRALDGPHRTDLLATHQASGRPAAECSTGEQKAMLIGLVLARVRSGTDDLRPVVLLDEACAHLDAQRRAALADEICDLGAQVLMTGVDSTLFADFGVRAQGFLVKPGQIEAQE